MSHHPAIIFRINMTIPLSEIERCVRCSAPTPFRRDDPIEIREHYIEGCGQVCSSCSVKMNQKHPPIERSGRYEIQT